MKNVRKGAPFICKKSLSIGKIPTESVRQKKCIILIDKFLNVTDICEVVYKQKAF